MTNELVPYEELLKFKNGFGSKMIEQFLNSVKKQIAEDTGYDVSKIELGLRKDETTDPDSTSQRYMIFVKKPSSAITKAMKEHDPFSLYVRM
jgi:hypothetical protein